MGMLTEVVEQHVDNAVKEVYDNLAGFDMVDKFTKQMTVMAVVIEKLERIENRLCMIEKSMVGIIDSVEQMREEVK